MHVSGLLVLEAEHKSVTNDTNIDLLLFKSDTVNLTLPVMKDWVTQTDPL